MVTSIYPNIFSAAAAAAAAGGTLALQNPAVPPLKCPRCDSPNTKFCYYNNYSLAQPRHFCRTCKRYWTRGGTLRDVPVGGGCRKNKRPKKPHPPLSNSLPPPASDLGSVLRGVPQANLNNRFLPPFESKVGSGNGFHLAHNLQQSAEEGMSFFQAPFLCYDDLPTGICEGLSLIKENPMEGIYSFGGSGSAAAESDYLSSLPDSCSSMIRLL